MLTTSHTLLGAALFGGRVPRTAWAAAAGGLLPDLPQLVVQLVALVKGIPAALIFIVLYFQNAWQITQAIAHDFWLWGLILAFALLMLRRQSGVRSGAWQMAAAFAASGFLHCAADFLTQREEAHMQFWPLTRWIFVSPVSFHDPAHSGTIFSIFEIIAGAALAILLFRRFSSVFVRIPLLIALASYAWGLARFAAG